MDALQAAIKLDSTPVKQIIIRYHYIIIILLILVSLN